MHIIKNSCFQASAVPKRIVLDNEFIMETNNCPKTDKNVQKII